MNALQSLRLAARWCLRGLWTLGVWTLWLGLTLLLAAQVYVASTNQLNVPDFLLRATEDRLAASGMHATFGRTRFDPSGRVLIENVALTLPDSSEPLITARALYVQLDPWALVVDRVEPLELRATGVSLRVPAMLSPSGRAEEIVRDLDVALRPRGDELEIEYGSCRLSNLAVSVRGELHLGPVRAGHAAALPLAEFLAQNYGALSRRFANTVLQLQALDHPILEASLTPSETRGAIVRATLLARGLRLGAPVAAEASGVRLATQFPLLGDAPVPIECEVAVDELRLPQLAGGATARAVRARISGTLQLGRARFFDWSRAEAAAARIDAAGFPLGNPIVSLTPGPWPRLQGEIRGLLAGAPLAARGAVDFQARTAEGRFDGELSPGLLGPVGARIGSDLRALVDFTTPIRMDGEVRFGAGWRFQRVTALVSARNLTVYHVPVDEARGRLEFDGRHLGASDAYARLGPSFARGSYEQDLVTHRYRMLLNGRLRPLDISAWFPKAPWWSNLFRNFAFPGPPPSASADVRGRTDTGREATVFILVDSAQPVIRGAPFDRALARLFVRPEFDDGLELLLTRGAGSARGTFARRFDFDRGAWTSLDLDLASTLDLGPVPQILGPKNAGAFTPFAFGQPPTVAVRGHLYWTTAPGGARNDLVIDAHSNGPLRFHDFPFDRADFHASVHNDDITLDPLDLGFADGRILGRARVAGPGAQRKLEFNGTLQNASLGRAITSFEDFSARRTGAPQPALSRYVAEKTSVRFDVTAAAAGAYDDPLSFAGGGTASFRGAELGQVQLLGALSKLLKFTALRFTTANAAFRIDGRRLIFSAVKVAGANSAIEARGDYLIDRHELDFNAKIYPFQQSSSAPQKLLNVALAPFSHVFAMKLTGNIENPSWSLALGLGDLLKPGEPPVPSPLRSAPTSPEEAP